jgi:1-deoxy-D-xylulose-5-phosphate synthase
MSLLDTIHHPSDLQSLPIEHLTELASEIRQRIISVVGKTGGHLASNLGVTEITIALHYCFNFERDRLLWDVGHQCYPHKLLTGRNQQFDTLRQSGGLSGFPDVTESNFDLFNVGHAGTAIATALGLAKADEHLKQNRRVVAFVGDASIVNGLSFEGLNQAGTLKRQLLIVLNDNNWGIAPTQGALADYLARFRSSNIYEEVKQRARQILPRVPLVGRSVFDALGHLKQGIKATVSPHSIFEQLGFMYVGPVEGHDIPHMIELLQLLGEVNHPVLLHIHTNKGQGADFAAAEPGRFHSPSPFVIDGEEVRIQKGQGKSWTAAFSDALCDVAAQDDRVVALTAAMPEGTGLDRFAKKFPDRFYDIGIAESCTVDVAAGMAKAGLKPVVAIYSTFMQRSFDQIFQELCLQNLPVILCMDRAGLVGSDGAVHHGIWDISFLRGFPNMVVMAPADEAELREAMRFAVSLDQPCAIRYPRASVPTSASEAPPFELGKSRLIRKGTDVTLLAYGTEVQYATEAADLLAEKNIYARVVNPRFVRPIDRQMVADALADEQPVFTIEDHCVAGGFGAAVLEAAQDMRLDTSRIVRIGVPDTRFVSHGSRTAQLAECGLDAAGIADAVVTEVRQTKPSHSAVSDAPSIRRTEPRAQNPAR